MQQGGSPYQVTPEVTQYVGGAAGGSGGGGRGHMIGISGGHDLQPPHHAQPEPQQQQGEPMAEAASPISSRPPPERPSNFEELEPLTAGGFADEEMLAGEEAERGPPGNRWPRQETLALLKIRSEMDALFREATLKALLWEDVSRKLAELGYNRSAKKCKEKFENVHKYYKRTKEGRAGRQDGKSYRFFSQLEALHGNTSGANTTSAAAPTSVAATATTSAMVSTIQATTTAAGGVISSMRTQPQPRNVTLIASAQPSRSTVPGLQDLPKVAADISGGLSLSSGGSSTSGESSDGTEEQGHRKRKRSSESSTQKMMDFFEGLMKQVVEKQLALQQRFLEAIEKREEDRMIREEAWKRQEMARLSRELEYLAQERAMSASRDAALIAFLQKVTGQTINLPPPPQPPPPQPTAQPVSTNPSSTILPVSQQQQQRPQPMETRPTPISTTVVTHDQEQAPANYEPASSRWPKAEVLALINLRSGLEPRYQEAGPKGPLWEEISAEMAKMGYKRSAKRCKEKWENINKYFKKVKESNKKRPEDAKTCPYFHQLDTLYQKKVLGGRPTKSEAEATEQPVLPDQPHNPNAMAIMPTPISAAPPETESGDGESEEQVPKGNGEGAQSTSGFYTSVVDEGNGMGEKKPEDIVRELLQQRQQHQTVVMDDYAKMADADSDDSEPDDDDDDDEGERGEDEDDDDEGSDNRMAAAYEARYRRQNGSSSAGNSGSFISMIQ